MLCTICPHTSDINSPILFCFIKSFLVSGPSMITAIDGSSAGNCCSENLFKLQEMWKPAPLASALTCGQRVCRVSSTPLSSILGTEEMIDNCNSATVVWTVTENGLSCSSKPYKVLWVNQFHEVSLLISGKIILVNSGSVTQMYVSFLGGENPLALQWNLANGDERQVHWTWGWKWNNKRWTTSPQD